MHLCTCATGRRTAATGLSAAHAHFSAMGTNRRTKANDAGEHLLPFGLECPEVGAEVEVEFAGPKGTYVSAGTVTAQVVAIPNA